MNPKEIKFKSWRTEKNETEKNCLEAANKK